MEQGKMNEEYEIDIREIISLLLRRLWIIVLVTIVFSTAAFLISTYLMEPMYESTTSIYVMNRQDNGSVITYNDLQTGSQLTKDYMTLVTKRPVTEKVIEELGLNLNHQALAKLITVTNPANTRILEITVKYQDPYMAMEIANAVREASAAHIINVMNIEKVNVAEEANLPISPSEPNVLMNTAIGGILGGILAVFIIILFYIQDDTIKTGEDIEKYLNISVLGTIPLQKDLNKSGLKGRGRRRKQNKE